MEDKKLIYLEWIKDYCQNDFIDKEGIEIIPPMVNLVIDEMIEYSNKSHHLKKSESLGDYSVTFDSGSNQDPFPPGIMGKLKPYCNRGKLRFY